MSPTDEKDYSDYVTHLSNLIGMMSFFSGFMFTAYTILITALPEPSTITAQLTLWLISLFLNIFLFMQLYYVIRTMYFCKNVPPRTKGVARINALFNVSISTAMGIPISLMSLLFNLLYLALVQTAQWMFFVVVYYLFIHRPSYKWRKLQVAKIFQIVLDYAMDV